MSKIEIILFALILLFNLDLLKLEQYNILSQIAYYQKELKNFESKDLNKYTLKEYIYILIINF